MALLLVAAAIGAAAPAAAQAECRHDACLLTLAAMHCPPGQDYNAREDRCEPKGQGRAGRVERCPPGQQLDLAGERCVAIIKPAAPPAAAPPAARAPSAAAGPAPGAAPPPAAPAPTTCPAGQQLDARLNSCVPSLSTGGPAVQRNIPGDPLRH
jgi:hypothetical protein